MSEETKKNQLNNITTIEDLLADSHENVMEDYYDLAESIYDEFDVNSHKKGHGYSCPTFPILNEKMEGLEEGLYIFAGESNSGKTAMMTNLLWAYCSNPENKLFGIYYSLDDNTDEVIPRLIAMNQRIPISVGSKPTRYIDYLNENKDNPDQTIQSLCLKYSEYLEKREAGLKQLKEANKQFLILDRQKIQSFEQLLDHAKKVQMYVKRFDPDNNIIIAIDSLADLNVDKNFSTERERTDYIAKVVKRAANIDLKIPIFTSYHVRKLNHSGRPTLDDIKESSRIVYEASLAFLVFNDVSKNKQAASVYVTSEEDNEKHPVIELDWAKNKKSSYKGRTYHYFIPNYSCVTECSKEAMDRYDNIIYTK